MPVEQWYRGELQDHAVRLLLTEKPASRYVLDRSAVRTWLAGGSDNKGEFGHKLWMLINLELWFQTYFPDGEHLSLSAARLNLPADQPLNVVGAAAPVRA